VLNKKGFIDTMMMHNEKNNPLAMLEPKATLHTDSEAVLLADPACRETESTAEKPQIVEELIIEEVSIDGMCGVY
jgi:mycofactocin precursor